MTRTADTSREALASVGRTLARREANVLDALARMIRHGVPPTAYELLKFMQVADPTLDVNGVRPRLTALKDAGRVQTAGKRVCAVTDKRVFTWTTATPAQRAPDAQRARDVPATPELPF